MHRSVLGLLVVLVIFLIGTPVLHSFVTAQNTQVDLALPAAINYLVVNYNSTVGLIPEVPHGNTYWLYSDSFLALLALEQYNNQYPGNLTVTNIAANIEGNLSKYIVEVPNVNLLNQYMVLNTSSKTLNPSIFNASNSYTVTKDFGAIINITLNNGTGVLSSANYADISFLEAVYSNNIGQSNNANGNYTIGSQMFDGTGMNDSVFQTGNQAGQYQTYKLALYIYASKVLNYVLPQNVEADLLKMQGTSGGFYTGYDSSFSNNGTNTNTETTSLAILALLPTPTPSPTPTITPTPTPTTNPTSTPTIPPSSTSNPTTTPTSHPTSTSQPTPTPSVPEVPSIIAIALVLTSITAGIFFYKKKGIPYFL